MTARQLLKKIISAAVSALGPQRWPSLHPRLLVLTYHRILPPDDPRYALEQPGMVVTPETFAKQMDWLLAAGFRFIHISDWLERGKRERLTGKWCAITFDDGWQDNYMFAFPILRKRRIPFQIYVVSNRCDGRGDYWPGRLAAAVAALIECRIDLAQLTNVQWLLELLPSHRLPTSLNRELIDQIVMACKRYPESIIYPHLEKLEQQLPPVDNETRALLNETELREMLATDLLQIGCHTANHVRLLPSLSDDLLQAEVVNSASDLQQRFASRIASFCYPNGDYSAAALALVRKHYACAVTTQIGWNSLASDPFQLRRISMHEDATDSPTRFWAKLSGWL